MSTCALRAVDVVFPADKLSSISTASRRNVTLAVSACSAAGEVYNVEARSGAGEER